MSAGPSPIDELHNSLFANDKERGTRFERSSALVFAVIDEAAVRPQVLLGGEGRRARH